MDSPFEKPPRERRVVSLTNFGVPDGQLDAAMDLAIDLKRREGYDLEHLRVTAAIDQSDVLLTTMVAVFKLRRPNSSPYVQAWNVAEAAVERFHPEWDDEDKGEMVFQLLEAAGLEPMSDDEPMDLRSKDDL